MGQRINSLSSFVVLAAHEHAEGESMPGVRMFRRESLRSERFNNRAGVIVVCHVILDTYRGMSRRNNIGK